MRCSPLHCLFYFTPVSGTQDQQDKRSMAKKITSFKFAVKVIFRPKKVGHGVRYYRQKYWKILRPQSTTSVNYSALWRSRSLFPIDPEFHTCNCWGLRCWPDYCGKVSGIQRGCRQRSAAFPWAVKGNYFLLVLVLAVSRLNYCSCTRKRTTERAFGWSIKLSLGWYGWVTVYRRLH